MVVRPLNGRLSMCYDGLWILAPMSASYLMWYELICITCGKGELWFTMRNGNDEKWKGMLSYDDIIVHMHCDMLWEWLKYMHMAWYEESEENCAIVRWAS